ncbi:diacylglycerol kinase [Nakamurella sp.]|uniref:diacylglycerol kinase n=1 Tax=Nakamurella sp. TaxID=1869182 RepID=UPI00378468C7
MLRDVTVLVNPNAGRGLSRRVAGAAIAELRRLGLAVDVVVTRSAEHCRHSAAAAVAAGCSAVAVCGGDGAVAAVLPVLAGSPVPLGVLPGGSGNDFARALGLPVRDAVAAARVVALGVAGPVDLGRLSSVGVPERWFGTVVAAGFDARVNERMNTMTWPRGRTRYHVALVRELASFRPISYVLSVDGTQLEREAMLVAVGNMSSYGGGMRICPAARADDGLLDVTVVTSISRLKLVRLFPSVYPGRHVGRPEVLTLRGRSVSVAVRSAAPRSAGARAAGARSTGVIAYADGERVGPLPVSVTVDPAALSVLGARGRES